MKKKLTIICFCLALICSIFFATSLGFNFWMGLIAGCSFFGLLTSSIGYYIASKHIERLDKLQNDYLEEISNYER